MELPTWRQQGETPSSKINWNTRRSESASRHAHLCLAQCNCAPDYLGEIPENRQEEHSFHQQPREPAVPACPEPLRPETWAGVTCSRRCLEQGHLHQWIHLQGICRLGTVQKTTGEHKDNLLNLLICAFTPLERYKRRWCMLHLSQNTGKKQEEPFQTHLSQGSSSPVTSRSGKMMPLCRLQRHQRNARTWLHMQQLWLTSS